MSDFRIRRAEPGDANALVALARSVGAEREGWLITRNSWRSVADERRYLKAIRRHVGAAVCLMVGIGFRRRGIGWALLEQAVRWAQETEVTKLELHVFPHNTPAVALYEKFGFVREGYRKKHYRRGDELVDAILMAYDVH